MWDGKIKLEAKIHLLSSPHYEESSSIVSSSKELTLLDAIDRILDKGVVINGDITIAVGGADLLSLKINLVIASLETAKRYGIELPWEKWQALDDQNQNKMNDQNPLLGNRNGNGKKMSRPTTATLKNGKKRRQHR